jgi:hypothetical protein
MEGKAILDRLGEPTEAAVLDHELVTIANQPVAVRSRFVCAQINA